MYMICTLQGTNISPPKWHFKDDFPFPQVGYVSSLEGTYICWGIYHHLPTLQVVFFPTPNPGGRLAQRLDAKFLTRDSSSSISSKPMCTLDRFFFFSKKR